VLSVIGSLEQILKWAKKSCAGMDVVFLSALVKQHDS